MTEEKYDSIMRQGEKEYLRLSKQGDPYAFHKAFEKASSEFMTDDIPTVRVTFKGMPDLIVTKKYKDYKLNAIHNEVIKTASIILENYHNDFEEYEGDSTIKNAIRLSAEILLSSECNCDDYNGFDCGCGHINFIAQEALRGI